MLSARLLTLQQQLAILRGLLPVFDYSVYARREMSRLGFRRFLPAHPEAFPDDYSESEIMLSELIQLERSKELFAWPFHSWPVGNRKQLSGGLTYLSPSLDALRIARRLVLEQQYKQDSLDQLPSWESEIDPITRAERQRQLEAPGPYSERESHIRSVASRWRGLEMQSLGIHGENSEPLNPEVLRRIFVDTMLQSVPRIDFEVHSEGRTDVPCFSKRLSELWDIRFILTRADCIGTGQMDFRCAVVPHGKAERPLAVTTSDFLFVQFGRVLPGFVLYDYFRSVAEFRVNVRAFISLYGIIGPAIEVLLKNLLPPQTSLVDDE